jgi:hypothetical protein
MKSRYLIPALVALLVFSIGLNLQNFALPRNNQQNQSNTAEVDSQNESDESSSSSGVLASRAGDVWHWRYTSRVSITDEVCSWADFSPYVESKMDTRDNAKAAWFSSITEKTESVIKDPEEHWEIEDCGPNLDWTEIQDWPERASFDERRKFAVKPDWKRDFDTTFDLALQTLYKCTKPIEEDIELYDNYGGIIGVTDFVSCDYYLVGKNKFTEFSGLPYAPLVLVVVYNFKTEIYDDIAGLMSLKSVGYEWTYEWKLRPSDLYDGKFLTHLIEDLYPDLIASLSDL